MTEALRSARERLEAYVLKRFSRTGMPRSESATIEATIHTYLDEVVRAARRDGVETWQSGRPF